MKIQKIYFVILLVLFCMGDIMAIDFSDNRIQLFMETNLGNPADKVFHAVIPFEFGYENGGAADVYMYNRSDGYVSYVTGDLIGKDQKPSDSGNYELLIVMKDGDEWGANLIRMLAFSTLDESFNSGETMDIGNFGKSLGFTAIIFDKFAETEIDGKKYGIMVVIGITEEELKWKFKNSGEALLNKLKENSIYPYTIPNRKSIIKKSLFN